MKKELNLILNKCILKKKYKKVFLSINLIPFQLAFKNLIEIQQLIYEFFINNFEETTLSSDTLNIVNSNKIFYPLETKAYQRGSLVNYFLEKKNVRSIHPFTSCLSIGKDIKNHKSFKKIIHGYGTNSPYDYMYKEEYLIVCINLHPRFTTIIHHAEHLASAPYRYIKLFKGKVKINKKIEEELWGLNVLHEEIKNIERDNCKYLWEKYNLNKLIIKKEIKDNKIYLVDFKKLVDELCEILSKDPLVWIGERKNFPKASKFFNNY